MSLRVTDQASNENLATAGDNLDRVKFVRNQNYLNHLAEVVKTQDREINSLNNNVSKQDDLAKENQMLKEELQNHRVQILNLENEVKVLAQQKQLK